jgi:hypothetical protein
MGRDELSKTGVRVERPGSHRRENGVRFTYRCVDARKVNLTRFPAFRWRDMAYER